MAQMSNNVPPPPLAKYEPSNQPPRQPSHQETLGIPNPHVDVQWAEPGTDPAAFANEPWAHFQDAVNTYLSLCEGKKEEFLRRINEEARIKIYREIDRIEKAKAGFLENDKKRKLIKDLKDLRSGWKDSVEQMLTAEMRRGTVPFLETTAARKIKDEAKKFQEKSRINQLYAKATEMDNRDQQIRCRVVKAIKEGRWNTEGRKDEFLAGDSIANGPLGNTINNTTEHATENRYPRETPSNGATLGSRTEELYGFKAGVIYLKREDTNADWLGHTIQNNLLCGGSFPHQKIMVHDVLNPQEGNPLRTPCDSNMIRWFHFPTNNMGWIEDAIKRYSEGAEEPKGSNTSRHEKLLSRENWRGQMHGTWPIKPQDSDVLTGATNPDAHIQGPLHARHMRSRCSVIPRDSTDSREVDAQALPGGSDATAQSERPTVGKNLAIFLPYLHWETSSRQTKMRDIIQESQHPKGELKLGKRSTIKREEKRRAFYESVLKVMQKYKAANTQTRSTSSNQRPLSPTHQHLGKYLIKAAQVADQMDYEADERLLRSDINGEPPLHMRRTLDQYYFLTLDTSARDKDQVVYRGTKAGRSFHKKNTRVVMVDQLWLWILDDHTIITSFPRRWGRNKPDSSGVHKSLRDRLKDMTDRKEGIKSIHHLAVIIIDQCSRVFFDRTRALDERPEVMDLFNSAIGDVTQHASNAYDNFWHFSRLQSMGTFIDERSKYLDINPEGTTLREAQDIAEELKIMLRIYSEQTTVVKEYRRYLGQLNGESKYAPAGDEPMMLRLVELLEHRSRECTRSKGDTSQDPKQSQEQPWLNSAIDHVDLLLEKIENRKTELRNLEESALRTQRQLEGLLQLKQQQATIIEAKAGLKRQEESIRQGRAIMAFTIVTICFLPLGFFAAFFGMNNSDINEARWMTLREQIGYMFGLSALVIAISVGLAFSPWARAVMVFMVRLPLAYIGEFSGLQRAWHSTPLSHQNLEQRNRTALRHISKRRQEREANEKYERFQAS